MNTSPTQQLANGLSYIQPLLKKYGFKQSKLSSGSSSGGEYAACDFIKDNIEIGLIVRADSGLGHPNYTAGNGYISHEQLLSVLGHSKSASLVPGEWPSYVCKEGGNAFNALYVDLSKLILPSLQRSTMSFAAEIDRAGSS